MSSERLFDTIPSIMNLQAYTNPDFTLPKKILFFIITLAALCICCVIIMGIERFIYRPVKGKESYKVYKKTLSHRIQRLFEMIVSGTSVMSFSVAYVVVNHIATLYGQGHGHSNAMLVRFMTAWSEGKDFVLLFMICMSCVLNTILDAFIIPLKDLDKGEKATMRMLGMFYVIIIFMYLNLIGDESQYGPVMMYYFGLMVGRFIYFDASFMDFVENIKNVFFNLPYLMMCLILVGLLCAFGFNVGFFLERNYYIVGIFYAHLFLLAGVFILNLIHRLSSLTGPKE